MTLWEFLNTNFFVALSTILTVFGAVLIYKNQKNTEKQQIAALLVNEIRNAEDAIQRLKTRPEGTEIPEIIILPQNNWNKYSHLFTKDLDQDHVDSINRFYFDVERANYIVNYGNVMDMFLANAQARLVALHERAADIIDRSTPAQLVNNIEEFKNKYFNESAAIHYSPKGFQTHLDSHLETITFILNSPAGLKLKKIAGLPQ